jgi:hypothetical protein
MKFSKKALNSITFRKILAWVILTSNVILVWYIIVDGSFSIFFHFIIPFVYLVGGLLFLERKKWSIGYIFFIFLIGLLLLFIFFPFF